MDKTNPIRCRSCLMDAQGMSFHCIDDIEWETLSFKQIFEKSIGYPIQHWEPQIFCEACALKMIDWYRFKDQCEYTQNQSMVLMTPIKKEVPDEEIALETNTTNLECCRSCMSEDLGKFSRAVKSTGWKSMTFQEMFEMETDHRILKWEPQHFCSECTRTLIAWFEFRSVCYETQKSIILSVPIKNEPNENTFDVLPELNVKTEMKEELPLSKEIKTENVLNIDKPKTTFTFDAYVRNYVEEPLTNANPLGMFKTKVTNAEYGPMITCFKQILWSAIKGHIMKEIRFNDDGDPYIHEGYPGYSTVRDIRKFVELKIGNQILPLRDARHLLKAWQLKTITLYIYRFSTHVVTKQDCEKAKTLLEEKLPYETLIADCPFKKCPVVAIVSQMESHKAICSFGPDHNGKIFCCLSIGCTVSVASKQALDKHYETCPYKLLMDYRRIQQVKVERDDGDIDEEMQHKKRKLLEPSATEVIFGNCPFSDCHNPKPSKKIKK